MPKGERADVQQALTSEEEAFCQQIAAGKSRPQAYRATFDTAKLNDRQIEDRAQKLSKKRIVKARIAGLIAGAAKIATEKTGATLAQIVQETEENRQLATTLGQSGAAVAATKLKAQLLGYLVDKKEVRTGALEDSDLGELLRLRDELRQVKATETQVEDLVGAHLPTHLSGARPTLQ